MDSRKTRLLVNIAYYGAIVLGVIVLIKYLLPALAPFAAAFLLSAALRRPIDTLSRRFCRVPQKLIAFLSLTVLYAFIGLSISMIFRALIVQLLDFISALPPMLTDMANRLIETREQWLRFLPHWLREIMGGENAGQILISAADALSAPLMELIGTAGSAAMKLPAIIFVVVITVISSYFITLDYDGIKGLLARLCPQKARGTLTRLRRLASQTTAHLLRSYGLLTLITFIELCCGFGLFSLMGEKISYSVPLALIISFVDILPVLGVGTVLIPWAIITWLGGSSRLGFMLLGLYAVMYIARSILESRLVGQRCGLHPALTLLALYVGGRWFGLAGVFLMPFAAIVLMQIYNDRGVSLQKSTTAH